MSKVDAVGNIVPTQSELEFLNTVVNNWKLHSKIMKKLKVNLHADHVAFVASGLYFNTASMKYVESLGNGSNIGLYEHSDGKVFLHVVKDASNTVLKSYRVDGVPSIIPEFTPLEIKPPLSARICKDIVLTARGLGFEANLFKIHTADSKNKEYVIALGSDYVNNQFFNVLNMYALDQYDPNNNKSNFTVKFAESVNADDAKLIF
jgi:hypothetical protein